LKTISNHAESTDLISEITKKTKKFGETVPLSVYAGDIVISLFKGTVQRDLIGWKWYHLIDPS
jgi:hypothetical protein